MEEIINRFSWFVLIVAVNVIFFWALFQLGSAFFLRIFPHQPSIAEETISRIPGLKKWVDWFFRPRLTGGREPSQERKPCDPASGHSDSGKAGPTIGGDGSV